MPALAPAGEGRLPSWRPCCARICAASTSCRSWRGCLASGADSGHARVPRLVRDRSPRAHASLRVQDAGSKTATTTRTSATAQASATCTLSTGLRASVQCPRWLQSLPAKSFCFPRRAKHGRHTRWQAASRGLDARIAELERRYGALDRGSASALSARMRTALFASLAVHVAHHLRRRLPVAREAQARAATSMRSKSCSSTRNRRRSR